MVIAIAMQIFQQFTGMNAILFHAPISFTTMDFGNNASLYATLILGAVNVLSTIVSIFLVEKVGRRMLLVEAGIQMLLSQLVIGILLAFNIKDHSNSLSYGLASVVVVMACTFVSAFAWSWGPLRWLITSETFPVETRSAGQSVTVCMNMLCCFLIGQVFLLMLCSMKYAVFFLFFCSWVLVMSLFVLFLVRETKNVRIEEMTESAEATLVLEEMSRIRRW